MRILRCIGFVLAASFFFVACGLDDKGNILIEEGAAGGSISVHVSDGNPKSRPIYTWSDAGTDISSSMAREVKVARASDLNTIVWAVTALDPSQNTVQSPIQHGTTQAGTIQAADSELDLGMDITYRVTVTKADSTFGYREFTVLP